VAAWLAAPASAEQNDEVADRAGKKVTLRVGPGFSYSAADSVARILESEGCPVEVTTDGLFDNEIEVEVGDDFGNFESPGSAGAYALDLCKK
jgi:hypothetical protein